MTRTKITIVVYFLFIHLISSWPTNCTDESGLSWGPCGPGREWCGPAFANSNTPQYHVRSASCAENDPNFSFYDSVHGLYHHFWQERIAEPQNGEGGGPVIGHAVSADLAVWARLPVALWNDAPYDTRAIFTRSTTIVNGVPTMVYPGLCTQHSFPGCTGMVFGVAVPADHAGDPFLKNWVKPTYNPILNATGDDPTSAWRTEGGEWRMTRKDGRIFFSTNFIHWAPAACAQPGGCGPNGEFFNVSECSDFFPLPPFCTGVGCSEGGPSPPPDFVHKASLDGDFYTLGQYTSGPPGSTGLWVPTHSTTPWVPLLQPLDSHVRNDSKPFQLYAAVAKTFWDPSQSRRVLFSWVKVLPEGTQSLAREVYYHSQLARLTFAPVPAMESLRKGQPLFEQGTLNLPANASYWLGDWAPGVGNQSEFIASFELPLSGPPAVFGVVFNANSDGSVGNALRIVYDPSSNTGNVSWGGAVRDIALPMLDGENDIGVHVFLDRSIAEAFVGPQGQGRLAFTLEAGSSASAGAAGMLVFTEQQAITVKNVSVWHLDSCWKTPEEVLARRGKGK